MFFGVQNKYVKVAHMHYAAGYLTTKSIYMSACGEVSCTANGILVVSKQEPNLPPLTKHRAAL